MAEQQIQVGQIVQLKSGGPKMTVGELEENRAWCWWFDESGTQKADAFPKTVLTQVDTA